VTAAAGDMLYGRIGESGSAGLFSSRVEIWRPDGTSCSGAGGYNAEVNCSATVAGSYVVMGMANTYNSGAYGLYLERLNNPASPAGAYGTNYTGRWPGAGSSPTA